MTSTNKRVVTNTTKESPSIAITDDKGSMKTLKEGLKHNHKYQSPLLIRSKDASKYAQNALDTEATIFAKQLFDLQGREKREVAQHLSKQDEFGLLVAKKYMELLTFSRIGLEESLRLLLKKLALLGETQERERILKHFAYRYKECNPHFLEGDLDTIHTLVCATVLLNTDLHRVNLGGASRMTSKEFINNLSGLGVKGGDFPVALLKDIYRSIKKKSLPWCEFETPQTTNLTNKKIPSVHTRKIKEKSNQTKRGLRSQSMHQQDMHMILPQPLFQDGTSGRRIGAGRSNKTKTLPRTQGVLWRKSILDRDGNKVPKRKRKWKLFFVVLQGLELQLTKRDSADSSVVPIHHSLAEAEVTSQSTKRTNVLRLSLANGSVALYQASSNDEQKNWIRSINRNAALLSSAPLSAGIGSQLKFQPPLLPSASSTLPLNKQLNEQQDRLELLCSELDEHEINRPSDGALVTEKQYYSDKLYHLRHEVHKYEVYTNALAELLRSTGSQNINTPSKPVGIKGNLKSATGTGSLLSVSPSEPGTFSYNTLSAFPRNDETAGSVGDLLETDPQKRHHHLTVGTFPLGPTSSLPNLHPQDIRRFPEISPKYPPQQSSEGKSSERNQPVPEINSGNSSIRKNLSVSPLNTSNSNSCDVIHSHASPPFPSKVNNANISVSSAEKIPSTSKTFISHTTERIRRPREDETAGSHPAFVVSTSHPSPVFENKTLMRGAPKAESQRAKFSYRGSPPASRLQREKNVTVRQSYLEAMSEPPQS